MSSTAVSHDLSPITTSVDDLLVLWQHPVDRSILPIGRFGFDGRTYSFAYTRTAREIDGFRPLPGLRDLATLYESTVLFPAFRSRVMTPGRPDYESYLHTLGLDAAELCPWEQIVRSGGGREGDTLQFVQVPTPRDGVLDTRFLAHGIRHVPARLRALNGLQVKVSPEEHEQSLNSLAPGDRLDLLEERSEHSEFATVVASENGVPLGYIPEVFGLGVRKLMSTAAPDVTVQRINPATVPPHMRLALRLRCEVPTDFSFDPEGRWEPLP